MATQIQSCLRHIARRSLRTRCLEKSAVRVAGATRTYSRYGPDDVNLPPDIPEYESLNIRLRSYDFVILESYATYVHNTTKRLGIDCNAFPTPARTSTVCTFIPRSTNVQTEHKLLRYERTIQIEFVPSTLAPILFEVLNQQIPEGVQMTIKEPEPFEEEFRHVPDVFLAELHEQVDELDKAREERRK